MNVNYFESKNFLCYSNLQFFLFFMRCTHMWLMRFFCIWNAQREGNIFFADAVVTFCVCAIIFFNKIYLYSLELHVHNKSVAVSKVFGVSLDGGWSWDVNLSVNGGFECRWRSHSPLMLELMKRVIKLFRMQDRWYLK